VSLTPCPECSRQISTAAFACPGCGHPRPALEAVPRRRRIDWLVPAIAAGGLLTSMVGVAAVRGAAHRHHAGAHRVEVVRTIEVQRFDGSFPPPPSVVEIAIDHSMEASEMDAMEAPPRIFNP